MRACVRAGLAITNYHRCMGDKQLFESSADTKWKVIAAATHLFAAKGMENVSLRELTSAAGVNLAAVNYHFGSKEALCEAVLDSLADRVNARRLAQLDAVLAQAEAARQQPSLEKILETFMQPYLGADQGGEGALLAQLVLKHRLSPNEMTTRIIQRHFDPLARRYVAAFSLACPNVDPSSFYWRYMYMAGTVILTSTDRSNSNRISTISDGQYDASDPVALHRSLMSFLVAAISAPA